MKTFSKQAAVSNHDISVDEYHQRSKHSLQKYAKGPDGLDWDTQPDPFRYFEGCPRIALPLRAKNLVVDFNDLYHKDNIIPAVIDRNSIGALFELSLGLSAWKVFGTNRWTLRMNPSSGNLHPTEAYLVFSGSNIMSAGVYHYNSYHHCLEQRCNIKGSSNEINTLFTDSSFIIGLSSIHWREAWKYGERAYRYCQHDIGHAIGAIRYAAALLGWQVTLLDQASDQQISALLGLDRSEDFSGAEEEAADVLLLVTTSTQAETPDLAKLIELVCSSQWKGHANCLSQENRIHWEIIEQISKHCVKPATTAESWTPPDYPPISECDTNFDASSIIRQRRSAQAFDATSELGLSQFYRMLDVLLPRTDVAPFDTLGWQPRIHLVLFVHRVEGLRPGLYVLPRSESGEQLLRQQLRPEFDWSHPPICPGSLPLYHLVSANSRNAARTVSCHQALASDGAFSISMLAEYGDAITEKPWQYRQLFWEAGLIGQSLYLEAEAITFRATGIGCFFDDAIHEILGINNNSLQVVYNFTVGTPVLDSRLISLPPYGHLEENK